MIETLSEGLSKCRWLCFIILIAFSVESHTNHALVEEALFGYITNPKIIVVINDILTGVVVLSGCFLAFQKYQLIQNNKDDPVVILSILKFADFESVTVWTILFKWAFVLLQYNMTDSRMRDCIFSGFHSAYWIPIVLMTMLFLFLWIAKRIESIS